MAEKDPVQHWLNHIAAYDKEFKKWTSRVDKILKRYRDENRKTGDASAKFNILWSNVQTLVPATFSRLPQPDVSRRFRDQDPVGRVAALIIERALDFEIQHYSDYRSTMKQSVLDRFLGGRGTAWARYEPHIKAVQLGEPTDGVAVTEDIDEPQEQLDYECAPIDYVHWKDFGHTVARTWEEVTAVWRAVYMTKQAVVERFGEELAAKIPLDAKPEDTKKGEMASDADSRALIYEIWDKETKKAIWLSKSMSEILDERDDPLGLEGFFPCPKPLYATLTNESLVPIPDFTLYQDQANTLDTLADRISGLIEALKVRGVYNAEYESLSRLFTEGENNVLIPVKNWAQFAEKMGLKGSIDIVDITPIFQALQAAYVAVEEQKQQIYDITGLADIVRGQSQASETATAQQIKGQYASLRLNAMKGDVSQYATEILQLKAQVMLGKFDPQTLLQIAAADQLSPQDKELIPQAMALLKENPLRSFRIEVAADSLVQIDEQAEKEARVEFLTAVGGYLEKAAQVGSAVPELTPLLMDLLKFGVTGFKVGKTVEGAFDETAEKLKVAAEQRAQNPQPNPEVQKAQMEQQAEQMRMQAEQQREGARMQLDQQREAAKIQAEQQIAQIRLQAEQQQAEQQAALELQKAQIQAQVEAARNEAEAAREAKRMEQEMAFQQWKAELDARTKIEIAEIQAQTTLQSSQAQAATEASKGQEVKDRDNVLAKSMDGMAEAIKAIRAPRRIVRDSEGRAEGIE